MKILLVEDNLPDAVLLRELLRSDWREPPELVHAIDMSDALRCVQREAFDVALLDLSLPDAFGDETFRRLNRQAPNLPIIALTGLDDETLATELAQAGAQDYLVKGHLDAGILHRAIRYAIERKRAEEKLRLAATVFESTLEAILITDANGAIISVNRAFCDITGYSESDVLGRNPNLLQSGRHRRGFFRKMRDALGRKGQWQGETWHRRKSGEIFPTWMNVSAVATPMAKSAIMWGFSPTSPTSSIRKNGWITWPTTTRSRACRTGCCSTNDCGKPPSTPGKTTASSP
ncbi:PAS domain-containing response regulator [Methylogaea oryzae]|uniref:PAS domain-containing response regulator n=1 Tax=Methylogaea oryzae TaxID=1295382 RepID=UPI0009EA6BFC|nr:response regulator [Methylogaea oryzae]